VLNPSNELVSFSEAPSRERARQIRKIADTIEENEKANINPEDWHRGKRHLDYYLENKINALSAIPLTQNWVETMCIRRL